MSPVDVELVIVGGGRMGEALAGGLLAAGRIDPARLVVVERLDGRRRELAADHPDLRVTDAPVAAAGAVLAVKPADIVDAARAAAAAGARRLLSIAAGVTTADVEAASGDVAVVRAMPNTPALVRRGAAAVAAGSRAGPDDLAWAEGILSSVGTVVRVAEDDLDAVTGLSGSGPAYVFLVAEAMIDAGVRVGLSRAVARELVVATLAGSAELLAAGPDGAAPEPAELRARVTSPGGTTAAGLHALESRAVRAAFADAVAAATGRSRELGL